MKHICWTLSRIHWSKLKSWAHFLYEILNKHNTIHQYIASAVFSSCQQLVFSACQRLVRTFIDSLLHFHWIKFSINFGKSKLHRSSFKNLGSQKFLLLNPFPSLKNYSNILTVILFEGKITRFWIFFTFTAKQPSHRSGDCETTGKTLLSPAFHLICFPSNGNYNSKNPKTTIIRKPNPMKQKPLLSS